LSAPSPSWRSGALGLLAGLGGALGGGALLLQRRLAGGRRAALAHLAASRALRARRRGRPSSLGGPGGFEALLLPLGGRRLRRGAAAVELGVLGAGSADTVVEGGQVVLVESVERLGLDGSEERLLGVVEHPPDRVVHRSSVACRSIGPHAATAGATRPVSPID